MDHESGEALAFTAADEREAVSLAPAEPPGTASRAVEEYDVADARISPPREGEPLFACVAAGKELPPLDERIRAAFRLRSVPPDTDLTLTITEDPRALAAATSAAEARVYELEYFFLRYPLPSLRAGAQSARNRA